MFGMCPLINLQIYFNYWSICQEQNVCLKIKKVYLFNFTAQIIMSNSPSIFPLILFLSLSGRPNTSATSCFSVISYGTTVQNCVFSFHNSLFVDPANAGKLSMSRAMWLTDHVPFSLYHHSV